MKVKVYVTPRTVVLHPESKAIKHMLERLGFEGIETLAKGRSIEFSLPAHADKAKATEILKRPSSEIYSPAVEDIEIIFEDPPLLNGIDDMVVADARALLDEQYRKGWYEKGLPKDGIREQADSPVDGTKTVFLSPACIIAMAIVRCDPDLAQSARDLYIETLFSNIDEEVLAQVKIIFGRYGLSPPAILRIFIRDSEFCTHPTPIVAYRSARAFIKALQRD
jgi:phosphoribosylformylglycinamidine (FGAM) synthase PurS component